MPAVCEIPIACENSPLSLWERAGVRVCGLLVIVLPLAGCDDRPLRVPVAGKVLIDGQPLTQGSVCVIPAGDRPAGGRINSDGTFRLTTFDENDGCVLGTHPVMIVARQQITPTRMKWLIPKKYQTIEGTDQKVTIDAPTENLVIELTWAGGAPFIEDATTGQEAAPTPIAAPATSANQD
ncbi:MAG: hypothetical protein SFU86_21100 [Pirellulaceae bacterium]|nr:hypothetical protein [Pirellulaceae bacterium]